MVEGRRARDLDLLDTIDALARESFSGSVWRVAREDRDPVLGSRPSARWDPGSFDVLYTSLQREGALAEIYFHLSRQPVFPTKIAWVIHAIDVRTRSTLRFADLSELRRVGVDVGRYADLDYTRTQAIGEAAHFLGFDGLIVPNARWSCLNLILFTDRIEPAALSPKLSEPVNWERWRKQNDDRRRREQ